MAPPVRNWVLAAAKLPVGNCAAGGQAMTQTLQMLSDPRHRRDMNQCGGRCRDRGNRPSPHRTAPRPRS